jgi:hypothetical protein
MTPLTIASAAQYWERYYNSEFIFGMGTERILAVLRQVPPVMTWADLGSGSESLLCLSRWTPNGCCQSTSTLAV